MIVAPNVVICCVAVSPTPDPAVSPIDSVAAVAVVSSTLLELYRELEGQFHEYLRHNVCKRARDAPVDSIFLEDEAEEEEVEVEEEVTRRKEPLPKPLELDDKEDNKLSTTILSEEKDQKKKQTKNRKQKAIIKTQNSCVSQGKKEK